MRFIRARLLSSYASAMAILALASTASAQIHFPGGGGSPRTDGGKVVGITLNSFGQTITSLGFYDHGQDGLATSYQLGLWDGAQNLLATATVTPSSPLTGDFRYAAITPITIGTLATPQPFTIGALLPPTMSDTWLDNASLFLASGFTGAGTGQFTPSGSLVYPTTLDSSPYYVVNANGPAVPEPMAMLALAVMAMTGLSRGRVRRSSRASAKATRA